LRGGEAVVLLFAEVELVLERQAQVVLQEPGEDARDVLGKRGVADAVLHVGLRLAGGLVDAFRESEVCGNHVIAPKPFYAS
jgi:hypothetical protein